MKIAYFETMGKPLKIIIATYVNWADKLIDDLKKKYKLDQLKKKHDVVFTNLNQLSDGKTFQKHFWV